MRSRPFYTCALISLLFIVGCAGGDYATGPYYYGHRYGPDPWYYRGGYVRDRVHVVSEEEIRALEELDSDRMSIPAEPAPDMGFGYMGMDMDFDGGDLDF